jgi:hypothetical protein
MLLWISLFLVAQLDCRVQHRSNRHQSLGYSKLRDTRLHTSHDPSPPTPPPIPPNAKFFIDVTRQVGPWKHYWEECVGSGHAGTTLRADWQQQLAQTHKDLGFKQVWFHFISFVFYCSFHFLGCVLLVLLADSEVRFHGLFVDDMSVVLPAPYSGTSECFLV